MAATYLQLPPEQGGLTLGPFNGVVHIGSDTRRCQVVLDSNQGVYPLHATLAPAPGGIYHFAPSEMAAKCFVVQAGNPQMWPVSAAVQVNPGDALIIGNPGGPRLTIQTTGPAASAGGNRVSTGGGSGAGVMSTLGSMFSGTGSYYQNRRNQSMSQGIADEFARRGRSRLMTMSPFREIYQMSHSIRSGRFFNPVYIVGSIMTLVGVLGAGTVSCTGLLWSLWREMGGG